MKRKIVSVCLAVGMCFGLFGCQKQEKTHGIQITEETTLYSYETKDNAWRSIYHFAIAVYGQSVAITDKDKIERFSRNYESVISRLGIPEKDYDAFFTKLDNDTPMHAERYKKYLKGELGLMETFDPLIDDIVNSFGTTTLSNIVQKTVLYFYDNKIDTARNNRIKYTGTALYEYYSEQEKTLMADKKVFQNIDNTVFKNFLKSCIMSYKVTEVFSSSGSVLENFTTREISMFLKNLDFCISFTENEWKVVSNLFKSFGGNVGDFIYAVQKYGYVDKVGNALNDVFLLLETTKKTMSEDKVKSLLEEDKSTFWKAVIDGLDETEWEILERIFSLELKESEFVEILEKTPAYEKIVTHEKKTVEDLKNCSAELIESTLYGVIHGVFYD